VCRTDAVSAGFRIHVLPGAYHMSDSYYVRIRGEVKGPVARSELVSQIRKKRMGRHHEVSTDAVTWMRAGDVPDLFEPVVAVRNVVEPTIEHSAASASKSTGSRAAADDGFMRRDAIDWAPCRRVNSARCWRLGASQEATLSGMKTSMTGCLPANCRNLPDWFLFRRHKIQVQINQSAQGAP
jgi:hypothetical protein